MNGWLSRNVGKIIGYSVGIGILATAVLNPVVGIAAVLSSYVSGIPTTAYLLGAGIATPVIGTVASKVKNKKTATIDDFLVNGTSFIDGNKGKTINKYYDAFDNAGNKINFCNSGDYRITKNTDGTFEFLERGQTPIIVDRINNYSPTKKNFNKYLGKNKKNSADQNLDALIQASLQPQPNPQPQNDISNQLNRMVMGIDGIINMIQNS